MRIVIGAVLLFGLAGCGKPEVQACESYVKSGLKAPATYKRISATVQDRSFAWEQYFAETGRRPSAFQQTAQKDMRPGLRIVDLEYEAQNALAVPLREHEICAFDLLDGKGSNAAQLAAMAKQAADLRAARPVAVPPPKFGCCS